jgi:hypothetical protein
MIKFNEDGTVTMSYEEYEELVEDQQFLLCLQGAGVDNWSGYDYAVEDYRENYGED